MHLPHKIFLLHPNVQAESIGEQQCFNRFCGLNSTDWDASSVWLSCTLKYFVRDVLFTPTVYLYFDQNTTLVPGIDIHVKMRIIAIKNVDQMLIFATFCCEYKSFRNKMSCYCSLLGCMSNNLQKRMYLHRGLQGVQGKTDCPIFQGLNFFSKKQLGIW